MVLSETQKAQTEAKDEVKAVASGTADEYVIDEKRKELAQEVGSSLRPHPLPQPYPCPLILTPNPSPSS